MAHIGCTPRAGLDTSSQEVLAKGEISMIMMRILIPVLGSNLRAIPPPGRTTGNDAGGKDQPVWLVSKSGSHYRKNHGHAGRLHRREVLTGSSEILTFAMHLEMANDRGTPRCPFIRAGMMGTLLTGKTMIATDTRVIHVGDMMIGRDILTTSKVDIRVTLTTI